METGKVALLPYYVYSNATFSCVGRDLCIIGVCVCVCVSVVVVRFRELECYRVVKCSVFASVCACVCV